MHKVYDIVYIYTNMLKYTGFYIKHANKYKYYCVKLKFDAIGITKC